MKSQTLQHQLKTCSHFPLRDRGERVIMEPLSMEIDQSQQRLPADPLPFARCYQLEALEKATKQNTIVYLETGSGKTLIAVMLLRSYAYMLRKPSPYIAVFLVPQVVLVSQQAKAVELHTDLKVGKYWGEMGVDFWSADTWKKQIDEHEVLVMTPAILLDGLRHSFFNLNMIKVLIVDECHHARGKHPYACIMTEFYHRQLHSGESDLPRIFGMTASPIKSKGAKSGRICWEMINDLETLMNSKVYTCANESVLAEFIPFSSPKFKTYKHMEIPYALYACIVDRLHILEKKHESSLEELDLKESTADAIKKRLSKIHSNLLFSLDELGVWLALKAAESFSCNEAESDFHAWGTLDAFGESTVKKFSIDAFNILAAYMPSGPCWSTSDDVKAKMDAGYLTSKVVCLIDILLEYRDVKDIRCIIFVERVIGAIVLQSLLSEFLSKHNSWKTKYIAGNSSMLQSQTRKKQNEIVEEFRKGAVNIIVATSILEEGLDVQTCNLVIRFDPPATICSFIQSRGRARVQNSDYILMLKSGDLSTRYRLENYLSGGDIMRKESLDHASLPCVPLKSELFDEQSYRVESTGAVVTLSSSVSLIYFYCSRLPSDGYFKPTPRCDIDKEKGVGILHLPKSSPVHTVRSHGHPKFLKQIVCLDACKQLHKVGALTDNLVPDIVVEEAAAQVYASDTFNSEQPKYFPSELVNRCLDKSKPLYYCYLIELKQNFDYGTAVYDIVLVTRSELEFDSGSLGFDLEVDRGVLAVNLKYVGVINLSPEQVLVCRQFQVTLFRILVDRNLDRLPDALNGFNLGYNLDIDYLLLPSGNKLKEPMTIDWLSVMSFFPCDNAQNGCMTYSRNGHADAHVVHTKNGLVSSCTLLNSLVYTPHNGHIYCITGILNELDGNSLLRKRDETDISYKEYYRLHYGIKLQFERQPLFKGRHIHKVKNYLSRCRLPKEKESTNTSVELPAELCSIIMTPMSISTVYSFSFVPSIMHRIESMLIAINLTKMPMDHCIQNMKVPTLKVLEAITTKECQEKFHLESLETLGDSFLKYAASQQLFKTYQNHHEGLLSIKKDKIVSNVALCKLGCDRKLQGFIRNESFDPKQWIIPGDKSVKYTLSEECITSTKKMYVTGRRSLKSKTVADVVEALLGAFLSTGGETAALLYMDWLGIKVDFDTLPYEPFPVQSERLVNVKHMESLLNYSFRNPCLLVEALTHGSYMLPEIPRCYQRLEFLGDSVLDYLITVHLYNTYPGSSPGLLTDMRSASVNNDCYAQSAVKAKLHKHILHASHDLHKHIKATVDEFENVSLQTTFGWECETSFPKVLGDIIESLAGAIFVDSGYNKDVVFQSIRPLLEPLVTPETLKLQPVRELNELCHKKNYSLKKPVFSKNNGVSAITVEVEANGVIHKHTSTAADKKTAKKLACKQVLKSLKST